MRNPADPELWKFTSNVVLMIGGEAALNTLKAVAQRLGMTEMNVLRRFLGEPSAYPAFIAAAQLGTPLDELRTLLRVR